MKVFVALAATIAAASAMPRYLVIDLQAAGGKDTLLSSLPLMRNPALARQARQVSEDQDSYQSAPTSYGGDDGLYPRPGSPQFADARTDSAGSASGAPAYGAPGPAPHARTDS